MRRFIFALREREREVSLCVCVSGCTLRIAAQHSTGFDLNNVPTFLPLCVCVSIRCFLPRVYFGLCAFVLLLLNKAVLDHCTTVSCLLLVRVRVGETERKSEREQRKSGSRLHDTTEHDTSTKTTTLQYATNPSESRHPQLCLNLYRSEGTRKNKKIETRETCSRRWPARC